MQLELVGLQLGYAVCAGPLGTLYLASPDGQSFIKVLTDPKNGEIIKDWARAAIYGDVRNGAMSNS